MKDSVYHFDDRDVDKLANVLESRIGDNSGDHEEEFHDIVKFLLSSRCNGSVLDVGAGIGRISALAKTIIRETVALEPDESRWKDCHHNHHQPPSCQILCQTTTDYLQQNPGKQFDLVIISMVIQHLSTSACDNLLRETASLLKPDGIAAIFTTHTLEETKGFSFSGDPDRVYVSQEEFDTYAASNPSEQTNGLPVRRFSKNELIDSASKYLEPIFWRQCSYYNENGQRFFASRLQIEPEKLKDIGNSQFVLVKRRDNNRDS